MAAIKVKDTTKGRLDMLSDVLGVKTYGAVVDYLVNTEMDKYGLANNGLFTKGDILEFTDKVQGIVLGIHDDNVVVRELDGDKLSSIVADFHRAGKEAWSSTIVDRKVDIDDYLQ